ncbi:uncharacterized protein YjbI with pentapeptide repeats [Rhizobium sp. BK591]|uniref:pentapeptide repeat-containing protein n=1 Tax=Rhizobium sp. BK591 TaxID=2586985 RepID=UPI0010468E83|nr:pentapeptide repeat-containing protein [Rhizobium sp. BK591]MBB3746994.1 uncharacterized protein YjbI with pentapeptide repeats [Rhizobium sp. BK591]
MANADGKIDVSEMSEPISAPAGLALAKELIDQADDFAASRKALEDAVSMARGLWISFVSLSAYFFVAVGSVAHIDLFLENPLQLPLVGIKVPLVAFFWLAPLLYLIMWGYLLLNLKLMSDNLRDWEKKKNDRLSAIEDVSERRRVDDALRMQLPNFIPVQLIAAPSNNSRGALHLLIAGAALATVVLGPLLILAQMQFQFLPYHSEAITWLHRLAIVGGVTLVWYLWPQIQGSFRANWWIYGIGVALSVSLALIAVFIATFPGEPIYHNRVAAIIDWSLPKGHSFCRLRNEIVQDVGEDDDCLVSLSEALFDGFIDEVRGVPYSLFSNRLVLPDHDFVELDDAALAKKKTSRSFRGRHLEMGFFSRSDLRKADFTGAFMQGAVFEETQLQGAIFGCEYTGAEIGQAKVPGFGSGCADLREASLDYANLEEAVFRRAKLQGAGLDGANLKGAILIEAKLQGASLYATDLEGAVLLSAKLYAATLTDAKLNGAILTLAKLQGAQLNRAEFNGAMLDPADIAGASLDGSDLRGAVFDPGINWRTSGAESAIITRSSLINTFSKPTEKSQYDLDLADATDGVVSSDTRDKITKALSVVDPGQPDPKDATPLAFWHSAEQDRDDSARAVFLAELACSRKGVPYIAATMLGRTSSEDGAIVELPSEPRAAASEIILSRSTAGTCPGIAGLGDETLDRLREWAADAKSKSAQ